MAYDGWIEFNGVELVNLSRTAQLARELGIDTLWTDPESVAWIQAALGGSGYAMLTEAPWYDPNYPASAEFAGVVPLAINGLDDSTRESTTIEYITDGGSSGRARSKTLPIVANVALIASTSRGADYGKRWLDRVLAGGGAKTFCSGSDLRYFRFVQGEGEPVPPQAHRRDVTLSRGTSVTRKRSTHCSATWIATFTWTANDPFEYGDAEPQFAGLGGVLTGAGIDSDGVTAITAQECPVYDYTPLYDPLHPALVPSPTAPDFYPAGWDLPPGKEYVRYWARLDPFDPVSLGSVPVLTLNATAEVRMVRVSVWGSSSAVTDQCGALWSAVIAYLPTGLDFVIDGEQRASYAWDGASPVVRRTDSLVYGPEARPLEWASLSDPAGLLVTLDVPTASDGLVQAALSLVSKSD